MDESSNGQTVKKENFANSIYPNPFEQDVPNSAAPVMPNAQQPVGKSKQTPKWTAIIAFISAFMSFLANCFYLAFYQKVDGGQYTSLLLAPLILSAFSFGIPKAIITIILGIVGLKSSLSGLAKTAIGLEVAAVIVGFLIVFFK